MATNSENVLTRQYQTFGLEQFTGFICPKKIRYSEDDVDRAFKAQVVAHHPDKHPEYLDAKSHFDWIQKCYAAVLADVKALSRGQVPSISHSIAHQRPKQTQEHKANDHTRKPAQFSMVVEEDPMLKQMRERSEMSWEEEQIERKEYFSKFRTQSPRNYPIRTKPSGNVARGGIEPTTNSQENKK